MHRVKTFHCFAAPEKIPKILESLDASAPRLENLVFDLTGRGSRSSNPAFAKPDILANLFQGKSLKLKTLCLKNMLIPFKSSIYGHAMTSLSISGPFYQNLPSTESFIHMISKSPNLESISLHSIDLTASLTTPVAPLLRLPHLRQITFRDVDPISTGLILGAIEVNNSLDPKISIHVGLDWDNEQNLTAIFQPATSPLSLSHFLTTSLDTLEIHPETLEAFFSTNSGRQELLVSQLGILALDTELEGIAFPSLEAIRIIGLSTDDDVSVAEGVLERFSGQIRRVKIKSSQSLDDVLEFIFHKPNKRQRGKWNLPLLQELVLSDCDLDPNRLASWVVGRAWYSKAKGVDYRPDTSKFTLQLKKCSMTRMAFANMSEWVVEGGLEWDGETKVDRHGQGAVVDDWDLSDGEDFDPEL